MMTSHAELSGLRQGWRIITAAGKEVQSPQEGVDTCSNVRGRIWVRTLIHAAGMSKHQKISEKRWRLGTSQFAAHPCNPPCVTCEHRKVHQQLTLMYKVRSGALEYGAQRKRGPSLLAPAGGSSSKVLWQVSCNPGTQVPKHSL